MPVTVKIAAHDASPISTTSRGTQWDTALSAEDLLLRAAPDKRSSIGTIIQSSYQQGDKSQRSISPCDNGLVRAIFQAYTSHHHLVLRPEDVWIAILTQFNFYVNAHAEELRHKFVAHKGQKGLVLVQEFSCYEAIDYGEMSINMTRLIEANITDPGLRAWIMPSWTTTTREDVIIASVCMMGTLQRYFEYVFDQCTCGIPTATLLGERADWVDLANRVERLGEYGEEPETFRDLLRPIVRGFVETFDDPTGKHVRDFWSRSINHVSGSGINSLTGWITAFLIWDEKGTFRIGERLRRLVKDAGQNLGPPDRKGGKLHLHPLTKTGWNGYTVDLQMVTAGFVSVPVKLKDPITELMLDTELLAGSVGMEALLPEQSPQQQQQSSGKEGARYTVRPVTGWWMYQVKGGELEGKKVTPPEFLESRKDKWSGQSTGTVHEDGRMDIETVDYVHYNERLDTQEDPVPSGEIGKAL